MATFSADFEGAVSSPAPEVQNPQLREYWDRPVSELATLHEAAPTPPESERHRIYSMMLMALVHENWCGTKRGRDGEYPWNEDPAAGPHLADDYRGHNIAAIAVNGDGAIVDFDFNHNRLFNSSAEHAEVRLIRRSFSLAQVSDTWRPVTTGVPPAEHRPLDDYTTLADVTVYTSLESCAQCAGTMALGRVRQVVYLQTDPGMYFIGRVLRNLTAAELRAPLPIAGGEINLPYFAELDAAYSDFALKVGKPDPFWRAGDKVDASPSVTSFLCTKAARDIYGRSRQQFEALAATPDGLEHPTFRPPGTDGSTAQSVRTNAEALSEARDFLAYAIASGRRGTPHR